MKDKLYDPAGNNEKSPAPGMAAVNTYNESEEPNEIKNEEKKQKDPQQKEKISNPAHEE